MVPLTPAAALAASMVIRAAYGYDPIDTLAEAVAFGAPGEVTGAALRMYRYATR